MKTALAVLALLAGAASAETVIGWEETERHVDETVTVEGRVLGVHCSPTSCLLAFEPTFNRFTAVVQAGSFDVFPPDELERKFNGRQVRVRGKIVEREKKPEIIVDGPSTLELVEPPEEEKRKAESERVAQAQADATERLADVLDRIEDLTERLAAVQERMEALLANLELRQAALAAASSAPAGPPPPAVSGEGVEEPPRPAFETVRSVKRGMTLAQVERLWGEPLAIDEGANGWSTWYYGAGRSVSFDGRGRVSAVVGGPR